MSTAQRSARGGAALALLAQVLVGSSFVAVAVLEDYPIAGGQALRYAAAALVMLALAGGRPARITARDVPWVAALTFTGLALFNALIIIGVKASDPASVGVVVGCTPILLAVFAPLQRGERPAVRVVAAGLVVAVGAALVQWTGAGVSGRGVVMALGALACEAAFTLLAVPVLPRLGPRGVTQWACIMAVPMLGAWAMLVEGLPAQRLPSDTEALALGWMVVGVTAVAFLSWYRAVERIGPERAGLFCGALPISATLLGVALGKVTLTPIRGAGACLVAAGVTMGMALWRPAHPARTGAAPSETG